MKILAIESSCDETAAAVIQDGRKILSNIVNSQIKIHEKYGGVVPEVASREHIKSIVTVTKRALEESGLSFETIDAVAATVAPGLIGALLVGTNFAKSMSYAIKKPFIPVHHIRGHIAANYLVFEQLEPPFLALVVSGGHSLIALVKDYTDFEILGNTRDDAAGEAFDKVARVLELGYPGGAKIDDISQGGDFYKYTLPNAKIKDCPLDFSFSGLKTAVINIAHNAKQKGEQIDKSALAASFCFSVVKAFVPRLELAQKQTGVKTIVCAGGVAANSWLRQELKQMAQKNDLVIYMPPLNLCGDNAAMIGSQAFYEFKAGNVGKTIQNAFATADIFENICTKIN